MFAILNLDLTGNPIAFLNSTMFVSDSDAHIASISLNVSETTAPSVQFDRTAVFSYFGINWQPPGGLLVIDLSRTSIDLEIVNFLSGAAPQATTMLLRQNGYTYLGPNVFYHSTVGALDLSGNLITRIDSNAFNYALQLSGLDLTGNRLTVLSAPFLSTTPALRELVVSHNHLLAIPNTNNHIGLGANAVDNPLQCHTYGPAISDCTCASGFELSDFCGYTRCVPIDQPTGCPNTTFFNASDCSAAPWSSCVAMDAVPRSEYFDAVTGRFAPVTRCETAFPRPGGFAPAFSVQGATSTTDTQCSVCRTCPSGYVVQTPCRSAADTVCRLDCRTAFAASDGSGGFIEAYTFKEQTNGSRLDGLCAPCSVCPTGFSRQPCTATSDAKCTRSNQLTPGDIAAIALAAIILLAAVAVAVLYGRTQSKQRSVTQHELALTERLLGDVQEENELMEQAWAIEEADLSFAESIGEGAFGQVFRGTWG